jgi:aspartate aminotransferase
MMKQIQPSATGSIQAMALRMRKSGIRVYNFSAGDPVLPNHPVILEAAQRVLDQKKSPYAPFAGLTELRQEAADWMNRRYSSTFDESRTAITCGGKFAIYAALQSLLGPGDEVLAPAPYWVSYPDMIRLAGGRMVPVPASRKNGWKITSQELQQRLTARSKILIFNNASNPTGALYTQEEIKNLLEVAMRANLMVISDEVYSEIVFDGARFASCASHHAYRDRVIVVESCSKNFAMAGWRVGFVFGPPAVVASVIALQSHSTSGPSLIGQQAALGALQRAEEVSAYVRQAMNERRCVFFDTYNELFKENLQPVPSSIYYFSPIGVNSVQECERILNDARVALVPGVSFGMEGHVRFAFSEEKEEIRQGLNALLSVAHIFRKKLGKEHEE